MDPSAGVDPVVLGATGARAISDTQLVQELWSGYGRIIRCALDGGERPSVIVKHVRLPDVLDHPRGWATDRSHERKLHSYQVETAWYRRHASACSEACRVPHCLAVEAVADEVVIVLEDLDASGFAGRRQQVGDVELDACLQWLANFHATFMGVAPDGLWATGTYWHLATRPDEFDALDDAPLRAAAGAIDRRLADSPFQTLVHGDAKLANFCFSEHGHRAAAVDFQYVGGGCGMKDVAYFISSCLDEGESERLAPVLLDRYFELLADALGRTRHAIDIQALEEEWRALYPVAWTDFYRFLKGWSPGHWKLHGYSERLAREVLASIGAPEPFAPPDADEDSERRCG
ncbi:MAG: phosphotransferase [Actinomycetota bacterium]